MSVRVHIDPIRCRGHSICALLFSDGVELDDWGFGRVVEPSVEGRRAIRGVYRAAAACPNRAIVITKEEAGSAPGALPDGACDDTPRPPLWTRMVDMTPAVRPGEVVAGQHRDHLR